MVSEQTKTIRLAWQFRRAVCDHHIRQGIVDKVDTEEEKDTNHKAHSSTGNKGDGEFKQ